MSRAEKTWEGVAHPRFGGDQTSSQGARSLPGTGDCAGPCPPTLLSQTAPTLIGARSPTTPRSAPSSPREIEEYLLPAGAGCPSLGWYPRSVEVAPTGALSSTPRGTPFSTSCAEDREQLFHCTARRTHRKCKRPRDRQRASWLRAAIWSRRSSRVFALPIGLPQSLIVPLLLGHTPLVERHDVAVQQRRAFGCAPTAALGVNGKKLSQSSPSAPSPSWRRSRRSYPSKTQVKRGQCIVHGDVGLV